MAGNNFSFETGCENVLDSLTQCTVCAEEYDEAGHQPKLLACHHSYCITCLNVMVTLGSPSTLSCPQCRKLTVLSGIPSEAIQRLQTNFYVSDIKEYKRQSESVDRNLTICKQHSEQFANFCLDCEVQLCSECLTEENHKNHVILGSQEAYFHYKSLFEIEVDKTRENIMMLQPQISKYELQIPCLFASLQKAENDLEACFIAYIDALTSKKKELLQELQECFTKERKKLSSAKDLRKKWQTNFTNILEVCEGAMQYGNINHLITYRSQLAAKNNDFCRSPLTDTDSHVIAFKPGLSQDTLYSSLKNLSGVSLGGLLPAEITFQSSPSSTAGLFTKICFEVKDSSKESLSHCSVTAKITDSFDNKAIITSARHISKGKYEVAFRPQISGRHSMQLLFFDQLIPKVSFNFDVLSNDPVEVIGEYGNDVGEMEYPRDVCVLPHGIIAAADTGNNRIELFDVSKRSFDTNHFPIAQVDAAYSICGLAVDWKHETIVCPEVIMENAEVSKGDSLQIYSLDGKLLKRIQLKDTLHKALSVAVNSVGHFVVADFDLCCIFVFDKQGDRLLWKFGSKGSGPGQFLHPTYICIGENDSIIVSDAGKHKVQVFDQMGVFKYQFGSFGTDKGEFNMPFGVCADVHGNILVVDGGNRRIQIFKTGGEFVSCVESLGNPLNAPRGLCTSQDGYVYVADRDNHCIKKYKYLQSSLL